MKSVLISIQPKWCELIASGKKTIEVRKTKPKLETPFKVYIYMTNKQNQPLHLLDNPTLHWETLHFGKGKVIGEFVCDYIISRCEMANEDIAEQQGCIKREELFKYSNGKELFGWHISNLAIYDKPRELSEFSTYTKDKCPANLNGTCLDRTQNDVILCKHLNCKYKKITRPPQSWCYVEGE